MRADQPCRHFGARSREMGDPGVDVIPAQPLAPANPKAPLHLRVELAEIVEPSGGLDRIGETVETLRREAQHRLGPAPRAGCGRQNMRRIALGCPAGVRRGMRERLRAHAGTGSAHSFRHRSSTDKISPRVSAGTSVLVGTR